MKPSLTHSLMTAFLLALPIPALAQDPPMEWGEIPKSDLAMTTYAPDTNAAAVILGDYGETTINDDLDLEFRRHLRIKILSARGYDWGTHSILVHRKDNTERMRGLDATTYVLNADGDVDDYDLDSDDVLEEDIDGTYRRYRFTLPHLTPGCVIEIRYTITSEYLSWVRDWEFQYSEPVVWSEYRLISPQNIVYAAVYSGYEPFAVNDCHEEPRHFGGEAASALSSQTVMCNFCRWVVKDAPAIRTEPFMTTREEYINRVDVQLSATSFLYSGVRRYLEDWPKFVETLLDYKDFGDRLPPDGKVREIAAKVTEGLVGQVDKARALYRWVQRSVAWNNALRTYASREHDEVIADGKGSSAEITFLLVALFRAAGLEADPVLVSTRSRRRVQELYPIEGQFNHVVARVNAGGSAYLVDGTDAFRPFDVPPAFILNRKGMVVHAKNSGFFQMASTVRGDRRAATMMTITPEGELSGSLQLRYDGYSAAEVRALLAKATDGGADIVKGAVRATERNLAVDSVVATNPDSLELPVTLKAQISGAAYGQSAGDLLYVNPHLVFATSENPFTLAERKYPVDYNFNRTTKATMIFRIPDGYAVKELPPSRTVNASRGNVEYKRDCTSDSVDVRVTCQLTINTPEIPPRDYAALREMYETIVKLNGDQMVLQKKPTPPPAPQPPAKPASAKGATRKKTSR